MIFLSVMSFTASIIYFYVGLNAFILNRKSELCRIFFLLTLSLTIWSFAGGFLYLAPNEVTYSFWNKVSAFGWCTFEALVLYFVLILTGDKLIRLRFFKLLIMMPALIFLLMVLFLFGPNIKTSPVVENVFYTGNFLYNFTYLAISIVLIYLWGHKSNSRIQKKQANIIVICSIIPFLINLIIQMILPSFNIKTLPNMGQIFSLIMFWGVNYAIIRYQFMSIPTSLITNELFNELTGLTFLLDSQGFIMKANKQVYTLLDYSEDEIVGCHITKIMKHKDMDELMVYCESIYDRMRFQDISIPLKSGVHIPINISIIPLYTKTNLLRGFLIIGEDIRVTKWLQDEIVKHKLTNEKLQNSEMLFRKLLEITPIPIILVSKYTGRIKYLNTQAMELLGADGSELIGSDITEYFVNPEDLCLLNKNFDNNKKVSKIEIQFIRKDTSAFIGLVTMIPSIYQEEEVALSCIIDLTEQKRVEETLKQNNEEITNLNRELIIMNNNLVNKSVKDGLTNLYNHQYMNEILETKIQELSITNEKLCLMMLDIDHFKRVNDRFGHLVGDKVLVTVAQLLMKNSRSNDYIGRYGGEEFIIVLPNTDLNTAALIAENIRLSIQDYDFGLDNYKVTICIGVVQYCGEISNALINRADMLLYQAKSNGRNRVEK
ncbi:MAG: diguanylate cyclase [Herbinix sp.]|nr:diguanylate cyclase [Herbinix sp.]